MPGISGHIFFSVGQATAIRMACSICFDTHGFTVRMAPALPVSPALWTRDNWYACRGGGRSLSTLRMTVEENQVVNDHDKDGKRAEFEERRRKALAKQQEKVEQIASGQRGLGKVGAKISLCVFLLSSWACSRCL